VTTQLPAMGNGLPGRTIHRISSINREGLCLLSVELATLEQGFEPQYKARQRRNHSRPNNIRSCWFDPVRSSYHRNISPLPGICPTPSAKMASVTVNSTARKQESRPMPANLNSAFSGRELCSYNIYLS